MHLAIKSQNQYIERWGAAIKLVIATMPPFVVGNHTDSRRLETIIMRPVSMMVQHVEPRFQVNTAFATDLGHVTLLDVLEPITCDHAFNALLNTTCPERIVLLPGIRDVVRLVFANGAPFEQALTPDGALHSRYKPEAEEPRFGGQRPAPLRGKQLRPVAQLTATVAGDRVRMDGWLREDPGPGGPGHE